MGVADFKTLTIVRFVKGFLWTKMLYSFSLSGEGLRVRMFILLLQKHARIASEWTCDLGRSGFILIILISLLFFSSKKSNKKRSSLAIRFTSTDCDYHNT